VRRAVDVDPNVAFWFGSAAAYLVVLSVAMATASYDIWGALVVAPLLAVLVIPVIRRTVVKDDPTMVRLVTLAFVTKLAGSAVRYFVTFELYDEAADALGYHSAGSRIAQGYWQGQTASALEQEMPDLVGTPFIRLVTGLFYIVTGPSLLGGFLVFGCLSFVGMFLFYRALRIAYPAADHRRYALLLFFLPTLLYWPSSIGKEAWMVFTLGLATYGVALVLTHRVSGYVSAGIGLAGSAMVRPHMTALVLAALAFAFIVRRRAWSTSTLGPLGKLAGIVVLLVAGTVVLGRVATFFDVDDLSPDAVESVMDYTEGQTSQGGSEFDSVRPREPTDYPAAFMAVLFRPYLWESSNPQMLVAAAEGMTLLTLFALSWRRVLRIPTTLFRVPYVAYCVAFTVMFTLAFSSISNFGNMTRQRTQVFPYVLVLLALPDGSHFCRPSSALARTRNDRNVSVGNDRLDPAADVSRQRVGAGRPPGAPAVQLDLGR
jgi:hypothetical protein